MTVLTLSEAYRYCQDLAVEHYENFPVASRLLPWRLPRPIAAIYTFAPKTDEGLRILQKLENNGGNVFLRPGLKKSDYLSISWNTLLKKPLQDSNLDYNVFSIPEFSHIKIISLFSHDP